MAINLGSVEGNDYSETAGEIEDFLHYLGSPPREQPGNEAFWARHQVRRAMCDSEV